MSSNLRHTTHPVPFSHVTVHCVRKQIHLKTIIASRMLFRVQDNNDELHFKTGLCTFDLIIRCCCYDNIVLPTPTRLQHIFWRLSLFSGLAWLCGNYKCASTRSRGDKESPKKTQWCNGLSYLIGYSLHLFHNSILLSSALPQN